MSQTKAQLVGSVGVSTADSLTVYNGVDVTGVVTATSFDGDGSSLTGLANTDFINAEQVTVVGVVTASSAVLTGNISAASGTFTGNVTVGGTLTYDDVTNIDSIGVVTARTGVDVVANGVDIAGGGLAVTGIATFNDNIVGDNSTNISGINSVTATAFYGDGSQLTGIEGGASVVAYNGARTLNNDGANGRLDVFGGGNFTVFYEPGTFDTSGITSMRVRVVGAGSSGHYHAICQISSPATNVNWCTKDDCSGGGGAGGGYAHKVFNSPDIPGGSINVQVGTPWSCGSPSDTVGTSCFGSTLSATGGVRRCGFGTGSGGDVNYSGGCGNLCHGGAAGTQLGHAPSSCGYVTGTPQGFDCATLRSRGVERFPFDIFDGRPGSCLTICSQAQPCGYVIRCNCEPKHAFGSGGRGGNSMVNKPFTPATGPAGIFGCRGGDGGTGAGGGSGASGGGNGGYGGGGGGTNYAVYQFTSPADCCAMVECCNCRSSGAGGPGIVIVEW